MAEIEHKGIITTIDGDKISVKIISSSACGSCHAKSVCGAGESTEKIINVTTDEPSKYKISDEVTVYISTSTGIQVIALAYILPIIVIISSLIILNINGVADNISGLVALVSVVLYFFVLFAFKNRLTKKTKINIK